MKYVPFLHHDEYQCRLQTTRGYYSWINGKVERHVRTLENMKSKTRCDSNIPANLWCISLAHASEVYGSLYHSVIKDSLNFMQSGIRRSTHDFRV